MLEFFDYFLIGFVLAFVVGPWKLTFLQSAIVLLSSGIGAMAGAAFWGWMADKIGRRPVFNLTILNFSLATGALYFTPDGGWIYLTLIRTIVGFGVGGLYCVDLPLVQEFMPASKRGFVGGLVTAFIPIGVMIGSLFGGYLTPYIGWRGLFAAGGGTRLSQRIPQALALEMGLTGRLIGAERAAQFGLVNQVVPAANLRIATRILARTIAEKSPATVAIGKRAFYRQAEMGLADAYEFTSDVMTRNMATADAIEGIDAFLAKRKPVWSGA